MSTSLVVTCKRLGIDPFAYLPDLFGRIATHTKPRIAELLPDQWKTARQPAPTS
ncbi:MAG: transposase domain-containing protein [Terriglobia bacterium]